jgi:hypothetical protein
LAASAEADAAGGDAAEGHGQHGELASGLRYRVHNPGKDRATVSIAWLIRKPA